MNLVAQASDNVGVFDLRCTTTSSIRERVVPGMGQVPVSSGLFPVGRFPVDRIVSHPEGGGFGSLGPRSRGSYSRCVISCK